MTLVFKNTGPTTGLMNWLDSFKDFQKSLLIEIDMNEEMFVSKAFPGDHSIVKYSKLPFSNSGLELSVIKSDDTTYSLEEWRDMYSQRIKVGLFLMLSKFNQVVKKFSSAEHTISIEFEKFNKTGQDMELHATSIEFVSKTLHMHVNGCNVSEFEQIEDDKFFNQVNPIEDPMSFDVTSDTIKNLSDISTIFSFDTKKDIIKFYTKKNPDTKKWALYAYDQTNVSYDYMLGYLSEGNGVKANILVYRNNFFVVAKDQGEKIVITLSDSNNSKIRIESEDKMSTTIVAAVSQ